jgi:hypothetical protein
MDGLTCGLSDAEFILFVLFLMSGTAFVIAVVGESCCAAARVYRRRRTSVGR